jgi:hypothetical protein
MVRRLLVRGAATLALALGVAGLVVPAASASPTPLVLPQGNAFSIIGHSCGGIQEKGYATGFDPGSGFPTGDVYMSTRCGGSGRDGGGHVTTYSAWAAASWDFTGALVSYSVLGAAPAVNPTLTAYDSHGNEVYNQSGSAFLLLAPGFTPLARVIAVSPAAGPATGGTTVTITGDGFTGAAGVRFGGAAAAFTVTSPTSISATAPASAAGTVDVTVANAGGTSLTSAADQFTFVAAPTVTGVSPNTGSPAGGTAVTVTGTHFTNATSVTFGGTPVGFSVTSDTSISTYAPATDEAGSVDVKVTSIGGTSARTSADRFTYVVLTPSVTGVSPSTGPADGGTEVTITGANLSGATALTFGGVPAYFGVNGDGSITAYSPGGAGTVDVRVTTFGSTSAVSAADQFTYIAAPTVSGVSPASGPVDGGTAVTVTGAGFASATEVDFGGVPAAFTVVDDGTIDAVAPAGWAGTVDVTVGTGAT